MLSLKLSGVVLTITYGEQFTGSSALIATFLGLLKLYTERASRACSVMFVLFSCASDEPGPEGKNHLHTRHGLWSNRPPWGHPSARHSYI